jgi:DNA-binding transcriptional regulator LsrR (DeoR family)
MKIRALTGDGVCDSLCAITQQLCYCTLRYKPMLDYAEHDLLAQIAAMYYVEERTQDAIAAQLGLSRVKVYRLLKQARAGQVIQFTVNWPVQRAPEFEARMCSVFGLREALVLKPDSSDHTYVLARISQLGARFLEQTLRDGMTLTVCLGRATYEVIHSVRPWFSRACQHRASGGQHRAGDAGTGQRLAHARVSGQAGRRRTLSRPRQWWWTASPRLRCCAANVTSIGTLELARAG